MPGVPGAPGRAVAQPAYCVRRREGTRQRLTAALHGLAAAFPDRFDERAPVLRHGDPQLVIPEFVVAAGIDVLVMGTVARGGLSGLLIGNTAERVLRKLPCSVLTVKPDGFVSPVRLPGQ